ncbi:reverse transcriptase domain-containing protein [Tanacetum coccineum]
MPKKRGEADDKGRNAPRRGGRGCYRADDCQSQFSRPNGHLWGRLSKGCKEQLKNSFEKHIEVFALGTGHMELVVGTKEVNRLVQSGDSPSGQLQTYITYPVLVKKVRRIWENAHRLQKPENSEMPKGLLSVYPNIDCKVGDLWGLGTSAFWLPTKGLSSNPKMAKEDKEKDRPFYTERELLLHLIKSKEETGLLVILHGDGRREAVSAVLLTDRNGRQCPVQYVSRTLSEAERNYSPLEKLALSLINMTRRLRRYFEAHPVKVITDQPIKNILSRTEVSGKLAKYAVEIGTYKISFIPRNAVKGQVLADFLSDAPDGEREDEYFQSPEVSPEIDDTEAWTLYTDGAASSKGSGAGLILTGPSGVEYAYALRLTFASTNNEAEYEALLAGLRIARMMNVLWIEVKVDSKLVASQINGIYEASNDSMIKYLAKAREYISEFQTFSIENIPRGSNQKADVLSKLATVPFHNLTKEILVEVLNERSTEVREVQTIVEEEGDNWMTPIIKYLEEGIVPSDKNEARALRAKIGQYTMESGVLFKKGYLIPMLRCVGPLQANYVIREIHLGSCGMHVGPRAVVRKAIRQGYYWPTMHADAKTEVDKCDSCQIHSPIPRLPKTFMTSIMAPWPFYQWGMDILGPLTPARGGAKFVVVAIDYFTNVIWFSQESLSSRTMGHNDKTPLQDLMEGIKTRLGREKAGWVDELPNVLWAHRTSIKQSNGETPFSLTYGSEAVIPAEIGMPSLPER